MEITKEVVWNGFYKSQLLKLVMQLLQDMGYRETVKHLEKESDLTFEGEDVELLRDAVLSGNLDEAQKLLDGLDVNPKIKKACKFLCSQHDFCMAIYKGSTKEAVNILRGTLCPIGFDGVSFDRIHKCTAILMDPSLEKLEKEFNWKFENSLDKLWTHIRHVLSPAYMIPPNRLLDLLNQSVEFQRLYCANHLESPADENVGRCLFADHKCSNWVFPTKCVQRFSHHFDEIWDVTVSPNGKYVATASKDECVMLWSGIPPFVKLHTWRGHHSVVCVLAWSSDSQLLASSGNDGFIYLWHIAKKEWVAKFETYSSVATSLTWIPNTNKIISASMDKFLMLLEIQHMPPCDVTEELTYYEPNHDTQGPGEEDQVKVLKSIVVGDYKIVKEKKWDFPNRIRSLSVNYNGTMVIFATVHRILHVWDLCSFRQLFTIPETAAVSSVYCSKICNQILLSVGGTLPCLKLWDVDDKSECSSMANI
ncbi:bifunctional WD40 repeat/WD40-YVTN repeat-like-containing domain superfamily/LIS1 homology motif/WD40-repeat-containing domain superfamily [Babesia duncani]|uniref:Bifunctional WD40 repeat/WD40-YVTN repeat-like-containing domain superfamily/LIS1 homology motif/WD40-repeat-containing domain superfamily n=1 Tax=Babesia duncani TaxID=323732 RepID=A0AAD9PNS7_9APIC|nr:bifunctional WD40 repeat/WD40-YVTN repeat-like-containing domain superfamily/LIS1 homology motif/WD40-repeat-containing domain superfamily [Babesia duncani]